LIDDIYATVLGEQSWAPVLEGIRLLTGARIVNLVALDGIGATCALDSASDDAEWAHELRQSYNADFHPFDPTASVVANWESGRWYDHREWSTHAERARSIYHQEFLRPRGVGNWEGMFLHRTQDSSHFLSLSNGWREHDNATTFRDQIAAVQTHLSRAVRMRERFDALQERAACGESALEALPAAVLLLDEQRRLRYANGAAATLMARESGLRFVHGRFMPPGTESDQAWLAARQRGSICIPRAAAAAGPLVLTAVPISARTHLARDSQCPLTLLVAPGTRTPEDLRQRLRALFDLTSSEAAVCVLICQDGLTPEACADRRQVSLGTIRSQIKSIFLKTGVARMPELVRLVATL
jgi:DNA-binding CsgD family transcriptional regulator